MLERSKWSKSKNKGTASALVIEYPGDMEAANCMCIKNPEVRGFWRRLLSSAAVLCCTNAVPCLFQYIMLTKHFWSAFDVLE